ncbi:MAG: hypothetical protein IJW63_07195 [Lachnospiraceae bacterium]|nr:hypothetical protein [Lachnospiraceae bacterium]
MRREKGKKETAYTRYSYLITFILLLILFQAIWHILLHEPYRGADITMETVQTIMREGYDYTSNPLTGMKDSAGAPTRWKILILPYVYAYMAEWTGISPATLVYELVPILVLLLSYLIYAELSKVIYPESPFKQCMFMLFVVLARWFGNYVTGTESALLLHSGYEGDAIRVAILMPLALWACLKNKWWVVLLCMAAEVAIVWTLYGLGYVFLIAVMVLVIKGVLKIVECRRTTND